MANKSTISMDLKGFKQLDDALKKLPAELQKTGYKAVITAGAGPIRKAARNFAKASKDSGLLIKSIGIKSVVYMSGAPFAVIGSLRKVSGMVKRKGKGAKPMFARPANYAHLVEYGTSTAPAKPFMRPAVDSSKGEVLGAMSKGLDRYLTRVVKKLKIKPR